MVTERARRAVVLVGNPAAPYSRGLRIARALVAEGYEVEIAAVAVDGVPDLERDGEVVIRRYRPSGRYASMAATYGATPVAGPAPAQARPAPAASRRPPARIRSIVRRQVRRAGALRRWLLWPHTVRGWWATLDRDLEPADLYHACGSLTIQPALRSAARSRRAGRAGRVVYDAIDNVFEGNNVLDMPAPIRRLHAARERRWARSADALTTVNEALAERLAARWGVPPILPVPNYPEPWRGRTTGSTDRIRRALGLPPDVRIVLFQGRLGPNLGLDEAAEAVLLVDDACLVALGFGRWSGRLGARDAEPRFAGRHFTLPAVHPDDLPEWTASADVALVTLPPVSVNQRASTPNKFWESLLVGTPVVLGPGLDVMAAIVEREHAGVIAASLEPAAIAGAIREILEQPAETRNADRQRVAAVAEKRYSWPVAQAGYRRLVRSMAAGGDAGENPGGSQAR